MQAIHILKPTPKVKVATFFTIGARVVVLHIVGYQNEITIYRVALKTSPLPLPWSFILG